MRSWIYPMGCKWLIAELGSGVDASLLRDFVHGFKKPSEEQERRILEHIHKVGSEFLLVSFWGKAGLSCFRCIFAMWYFYLGKNQNFLIFPQIKIKNGGWRWFSWIFGRVKFLARERCSRFEEEFRRGERGEGGAVVCGFLRGRGGEVRFLWRRRRW